MKNNQLQFFPTSSLDKTILYKNTVNLIYFVKKEKINFSECN